MQIVKAKLVYMLNCPARGGIPLISSNMLPNSYCENCRYFGGKRFTYGYGVNETKEIRCLYPLEKGDKND